MEKDNTWTQFAGVLVACAVVGIVLIVIANVEKNRIDPAPPATAGQTTDALRRAVPKFRPHYAEDDFQAAPDPDPGSNEWVVMLRVNEDTTTIVYRTDTQREAWSYIAGRLDGQRQ